jgi:hypothetical protein
MDGLAGRSLDDDDSSFHSPLLTVERFGQPHVDLRANLAERFVILLRFASVGN